jgi:hypothetical protein
MHARSNVAESIEKLGTEIVQCKEKCEGARALRKNMITTKDLYIY